MSQNHTPNCTCGHCGKPFYTRPSHIAAGEGKYCSRRCYHIAKPKPMAERFWALVEKDGPILNLELGPCWIWTSKRNRAGYGRFNDTTQKGRSFGAHRVSYAMACGDPGELHVCHKCDNPSCVNPDHLFLGTNNDNRQDSVRKDRHAKGERARAKNPERGEDRYNNKLSESDIVSIRNSTDGPQRKVAERYGVSQSLISSIRKRKCWKHLG